MVRRYIYHADLQKIVQEQYDVVIIGGGLAGMYTALSLPESMRVLITRKKDQQISSSWHAQGGVAAVTLPGDTFESHVQDTLVAGAGLCDEAAVRTLVTEGPKEIAHLTQMGVPFDRDASGNLACGREGGHSAHRIVHCGGDATGRVLVETLAGLVADRANITVCENVVMTDIVTDDAGVCGVILQGHEPLFVRSAHVVLCTGGIGRIYKYTTNPAASTGDGIAAAARAGAKLKNMEFVQFHPTGLALPDVHGQVFLISEAVRGDGGLLYDEFGERIMKGKHELEDLAPRDIVARGIHRHLRETGTDKAYLDIAYKGADFAAKRFPTIYESCLKHGIDITKQRIPVLPTQHYFMGGIETDLYAQTNVPGLYCVGESSCTGVHGANRLASNSLLECLVFGHRCAQYIEQSGRVLGAVLPKIDRPHYEADRERVSDFRERIRRTMMEDGGIVRNAKDMQRGIKTLSHIVEELENRKLEKLSHVEAYNMACVGRAVLEGALARKESVGGHYREDE